MTISLSNLDYDLKFKNPFVTQDGSQRAYVRMKKLATLWFNTGTLCNLACQNCYIESTPRNDRLSYLRVDEVVSYLEEIAREGHETDEIGLTGGEPFMNPDILEIIRSVLERGFSNLVLTNGMRPMMRPAIRSGLLKLHTEFRDKLMIRVSVDHFDQAVHEKERGSGSWGPMVEGLRWLSENNFQIAVAGRTLWQESEEELREGFSVFFKKNEISIDAWNPRELTLFPEMDEGSSVPEITTECWDLLGVSPDDMMCASSRMVVKHKGDPKPSVMACTLLAYDKSFNLGATLVEASKSVQLNHPHCAKFCVLGGGKCSG